MATAALCLLRHTREEEKRKLPPRRYGGRCIGKFASYLFMAINTSAAPLPQSQAAVGLRPSLRQ